MERFRMRSEGIFRRPSCIMEDTMMIGRLLMFVAGAGLIAMSLGACRRHCGHGFGNLNEKHLGYISKKLASKLDLDDAQKAKLETIKNELAGKLGTFKTMRK